MLCAKNLTTGQKWKLTGVREIAEFLDYAKTCIVIGHNIINFDIPVLQKLFNFSVPWDQVRDTLVLARVIWPKDMLTNLDYRRLKKDKSFPAQFVGGYSLAAFGARLKNLKGDFEGPWDAYTEEMGSYCEQDVEVTADLWNKLDGKGLDARAVELETRFALLIRQQEANGFAFNEPKAQQLYAELSAKREELRVRLEALVPPKVTELNSPAYYRVVEVDYVHDPQFKTKKEAASWVKQHVPGGMKRAKIEPGPRKTKSRPFNPASRTQVAAFLLANGWKPEKHTDTGHPVVDESVLGSVTHPAGKELARYFLIQKRIGQIAEGKAAWLKLCKAGRIHGRVNTNGAVTGRCTHSDPNMAQVPRVSLDKEGKLVWGDAGDWGSDCRSLFTADPGWVLVGADASGLELRCLAHYLARWDNGAYAKVVCEGDVHTENQKAFGLPEGKVYRNEAAKNAIYCLIYGGGDWKLGITCFPPHLFGVKEEAEYVRLGRRCRSRFANAIVGYGDLSELVQAAVRQRGYLVGIDGRKLFCRNAYSALNTLLQSAGALIVKWATVRMAERLEALGLRHGRDWKLVAHVHDEIQVTCPKEHAETVGRTFVESLQDAQAFFKFRCPLTGTFGTGADWSETH